MKATEMGKLGYVFIAVLSCFALYSAVDTLANGEYRVSGSGPSSAGAGLINFVGDTAGPSAVAVLYIAFAVLLSAAAVAHAKMARRQ
jgi:hypothetical protein